MAVLVLLILMRTAAGTKDLETAAHATAAETNEDRVAYLATYGWVVDEIPVESQEVRIPDSFPEVLESYNEIQLNQGFDLHKYEGKKVKRYVYHVSNYPDVPEGATVKATVLTYRNKVIGGDVSSSEQNGFIHGFDAPN
ncbi:MAG: DUF4830 domain-containing protein [Oscillospiraceae bacterium]|nr:DUF4830 domain-containing protein [Oscillospiraceae bacterium]